MFIMIYRKRKVERFLKLRKIKGDSFWYILKYVINLFYVNRWSLNKIMDNLIKIDN